MPKGFNWNLELILDIWSLDVLQALAGEPGTICQKMQLLTLEAPRDRIKLSRIVVKPWIRKIINARTETTSLEVHWSFRGGREYNIELSTVKAHILRIKEAKTETERDLIKNKRAMREELQRQIDELRTQERVEVQQLAAEYDARRAPFEDEMRYIIAKIDEVKGSIAPFRKLPVEILGNIFGEVVGSGVAPWFLRPSARTGESHI
jgi:hypothetical protein